MTLKVNIIVIDVFIFIGKISLFVNYLHRYVSKHFKFDCIGYYGKS